MLELSQELLLRRRQEEKEAQDLESMVQSVEQNLHLMTVRLLMRKKITKESEKSISRLRRSKHEGNSANCQSLLCVCETEAGGESREQRLQAEDGAAEAAGELRFSLPDHLERLRGTSRWGEKTLEGGTCDRRDVDVCLCVCVSGGSGLPAIGERQPEGGRVGSCAGDETQRSGGVRVPEQDRKPRPLLHPVSVCVYNSWPIEPC